VLERFKEKREQGIPVDGQMIRLLALSAPPSLKTQNFKASKGWLREFLKRNNITRRKCTHKINSFIELIMPEIYGYLSVLEGLHDQEDLIFINFDEVPFFDVSSDYTFNQQGQKSIGIISHKDSKVRATVIPAICSNGYALPPLFVFIYKYGGKSNREFPKKFEHMKNLTRPHMIRFIESGFTKDPIVFRSKMYFLYITFKSFTQSIKFFLH